MLSFKLGFISVSVVAFACATAVSAQFVRNDAIGNDPVKERVCIERAKAHAVPFEIDLSYVSRTRTLFPGATFIAVDGMSPQLIECAVSGGTGKYEPLSRSPEQSFWHLIKPSQFKPGINTDAGRIMATNTCLRAAETRINRSGLDHSVANSVVEVRLGSPVSHPGAIIAGLKAERYDIVVQGTSLYKSSGIDLTAISYTCLFSPMLDIKALELK